MEIMDLEEKDIAKLMSCCPTSVEAFLRLSLESLWFS